MILGYETRSRKFYDTMKPV